MKYAPALAAVLLCVAAACSDEPESRAAAPTAPVARMSASAAPASLRASSVCLAYARDRALVKTSLSELSEQGSAEKKAALGPRLERKLKSLDALIKDAC
jgi:hypothetical protein